MANDGARIVFQRCSSEIRNAGVHLVAYNYSFRDNFTDDEIDYGFKMAKWLGLDKITASSNVSTAKRVDPFAKKYKTYVGFHNHASMKPNEFSTPKDFEQALQGRLEVSGHQSGYRPCNSRRLGPGGIPESQHHSRILTLHLKDRTPNHDGQTGRRRGMGAGNYRYQGSLAGAEAEQVVHPGEHRIRVQGC